ncbi:ribonuclease P protein component [Euzebya tangerina]|uniref:ribonuclease P protein component n=1 Tax=Euzebya tangerina TaxID=591198 RepID=UPI0039C8A4E3
MIGARCAAGSRHVLVHAGRGAVDHTRVAVVAGRRVGNAVMRNTAKRRIRAALREQPLPRGYDLVVSGKTGADRAPYGQLRDEVHQSISRATARVRLS